jgi:apolipoprotein N-acyltransferase
MIVYGGIHVLAAHGLTLVIAAILGFFTGLFAGGVAVASRFRPWLGLAAAPWMWVAGEYLRIHLADMGWISLGYTLALQPTLIQLARFTGIYGLSFGLVALAALGWWAVQGQRQAAIAATCAVIAIGLVWVDGRNTIEATKRLRQTREQVDIVAVQPMVPILFTSDAEFMAAFQRQIDLARQGMNQVSAPTRLIVWPESQSSFLLNDSESFELKAIRHLAAEQQAGVLFNSVRSAPGGKFTNIAAVVDPTGAVSSEYTKVHLLPFGEYMPLRSLFEQIGFTPLALDAIPASHPVPTRFGGKTFGTTICFEAVFPDLDTSFRRQGAGALINIANDGWFGKTHGTEQHYRHLVIRAVENQLDTVRVTNTGISVFILATGEVVDRTKQEEATVKVWPVRYGFESERLTFYAIYGDVLAVLACLISAGILLVSMYFGWKSNPSSNTTSRSDT